MDLLPKKDYLETAAGALHKNHSILSSIQIISIKIDDIVKCSLHRLTFSTDYNGSSSILVIQNCLNGITK